MRKGMGVGWFVVGNPAVCVVLVVLGVQNIQKNGGGWFMSKVWLVSNISIRPLNFSTIPPTIPPTISIHPHLPLHPTPPLPSPFLSLFKTNTSTSQTNSNTFPYHNVSSSSLRSFRPANPTSSPDYSAAAVSMTPPLVSTHRFPSPLPPGTNTSKSRPHSSSLQHYRTLRNSSVRKTR